MRLPDSAHTSRPWRIHELTRDFRLEDVWALPTPGGPGDFPLLVRGFASADPSRGASSPVAALFALRWRIGRLLGWDDPGAGLGSRVPTLRDRLPADLRDGPSGPDFDALPFSSLYLTGDEWAAEIANQTMHGVMHMGWVEDGTGGYRGQMAVLVKPNGLLGRGYMAAIKPFRHLIVYPRMIRGMDREWRVRSAARGAQEAGLRPEPASTRERQSSFARMGRPANAKNWTVRPSRTGLSGPGSGPRLVRYPPVCPAHHSRRGSRCLHSPSSPPGSCATPTRRRARDPSVTSPPASHAGPRARDDARTGNAREEAERGPGR